MADADVLVTAPGTGTKIDTRTVGAGTDEHRQVMVVGSPTTAANVAEVDATFGLRVQTVAQSGTVTSGAITTATTSVPATVTGYGNATITVSGTYAGVSFVFEASDNSGTTYFPVQVQRETDGQVVLGDTPAANASLIYLMDLPGYTTVRVRATAFTSGSAAVRISPGGTLAVPVVSVGNTVAATAGTPTTTALSTTAAQVVAANPNRRGVKLWNNSTVKAFVGLGAGTVTTANASFTIQPDSTWEDPNWNGRCSAILASGTGSMNATEPAA
jgi:hypothetical protein